MRHQGRLFDWKDAKGFGFIVPDAGGAQVFVHIKAFSDRRYRPGGGERVSYALLRDEKGRLRAMDVVVIGPVRGRRSPVSLPVDGLAALLMVAAFFWALLAAARSGHLPGMLVAVYALASAVAFVAYAVDKSAAINDRWRTPESRLHLLALAGGWPGALLAQRLLRHKSSKLPFQLLFWATVVLHFAVLGWLVSPAGSPLRQRLLDLA